MAEVSNPLVFQCKSCRCILGDSFAFASSDEGLMTLTLMAASDNVQVETELATSNEGKDLGSSFRKLRCKNCQSVVGRMYISTPRLLDHLRDSFTFDVRLMTSYQLGSGLPETTGAAASSSAAAGASSAAAAAAGASGVDAGGLDLGQLEGDVLKIQQMIVSLYERVDDMETHLRMHFPDVPIFSTSTEKTTEDDGDAPNRTDVVEEVREDGTVTVEIITNKSSKSSATSDQQAKKKVKR